MRPVYSNERAGERRLSWADRPGVVYLMRCAATGEYKVGATEDPAGRFGMLRCSAKKMGRDLYFIGSIITNGVGRLERQWKRDWAKYRVPDARREWFLLPDAEAERFLSLSLVEWAGLKPLTRKRRAALSGRPTGVSGRPFPVTDNARD